MGRYTRVTTETSDTTAHIGKPLTVPLRHRLNRLAGTTGAPTDSLYPDGLEEARRFGWVYEYRGRVALTGAGAYHAS